MFVGSQRQKKQPVSNNTIKVSLEGPSDGAFNMSEDLNLYRRAKRGEAALRVYGWESGPWISIGRFQSEAEVVRAFPGFRIVRRPTGGAAVRHVDEITFAIALPLQVLPDLSIGETGKPSVKNVYRSVASAVVSVLSDTYPDATLGTERRRPEAFGVNPDCFSMVDGPDVVNGNGQKLAGSALKIGREAVLLQVSIPVLESSLTHLDVFTKLVDFVRQAWRLETESDILTASDHVRRCLALHIDWAPFGDRGWSEAKRMYDFALEVTSGEFRCPEIRSALESANGGEVSHVTPDARVRLENHFLPGLGASC